MNWGRYLKETDERKRWEMLQEDNRLSYDHVDDWLMSLKEFLKIELSKSHFQKSNHQIGIELESYTDILFYRGLKKEHNLLLEVASNLK
jgi:hypothetical protein